jgi:hypothetical protein
MDFAPRLLLQTPAVVTLRTLLCLSAFALGAFGVAVGGAAFLPPPHLPVLSEKRAYFFGERGRYDAVFIGSSRVYRGIVPEVFDAEMAALGHRVQSFNLGMEAVWPPESLFRVREFLRDRPRVRWVFIELLPVNPRLTPENARTLRSISWHDWRHTALAWRAIAEDQTFSVGEKWSWAVLHLELFIRQSSNLSRVATLIEPRLLPELEKVARKEAALNTQWVSGSGFLAEPETPMSGEVAIDLRRIAAAYTQQLSPLPLPPYLRDALSDLVRAVRDAGAVPIFFITPSTTRAENFSDIRTQGIDADLISFKDPARFPALYDPALHFDGPHLNERGARELSRLLAQEAAPLLQGSAGSGGSAR